MTIVEMDNNDTFDLLFKNSKNNGDAKRKSVFVDVGGYDGDTVKTALEYNPNFRVITIEPIKSLCEIMKQKFLSNKNIIVVNKAVWSCKCNIFFNEYDGGFKGLSTLQPIMTQLRPEKRFAHILKYDVEANTLDNVLSELGIDTIDYLKIDTEGSEEQVLTGFTKYNNNTRFHIEHHVTNLSNIIQKLLEMNADIEKITTFRDGNIREQVVGAIVGKFTRQSHPEIIIR